MTSASEALKAGHAAGLHGDYKAALDLWRPLAEQGNPDAQVCLGFLYFLGHGVKQDYAEAYFWYSLAAALKWNPLTSAFYPDNLSPDAPTNEQEVAMVVEQGVKEVSKYLIPEQKAAVDKRVADWLKDHPAPASK